MLGKLIKHEFKANMKLMLITHAFILLFSLILGGTVWILSLNNDTSALSFTSTGILVIYVLFTYIAMAAISVFGTQIYIAVRFYRNFFSDEGYLMFTLPTSPTQLLHSKIITGFVLVLINLCAVGLSAVFVYYPLIAKALNLGDVFSTGLQDLSIGMVLGYVMLYLLSFLASLLQIYGCICIGQLFHKNRLVAAIILFLGSKLTLSIISAIVSLATNTVFTYSLNYASFETSNTVSNYSNATNYSFEVINIAVIALFYGLSRWIMNRKLNLV